MKKRLIAVKSGDLIIVNDNELYRKSLKKYIVALSSNRDNFNCPTILVTALDEIDARERAKRLSSSWFTGAIKEVLE